MRTIEPRDDGAARVTSPRHWLRADGRSKLAAVKGFVVVVLALALASACGRYSVIGVYGGAAVGIGMGVAVADDNDRGALVGALSGAVVGLLIGGIIDLINRPILNPDH